MDELRSGYPVDRINGVRKLAPAGTEMELAIDLLDADPDAEVRAAAAEKVGQGVSYGATTGLVRALGDPDPRVVLAALQSLQFRGDPTLVPEIEPLLEHRDDRVRAAAANAIELLRWR